MKHPSPLRYPGGKFALATILRRLRELNGFTGRSLAEPFAGGAGASLALLLQRETHHIHLNDLDQAIYAFWHSATFQSECFLRHLDQSPISLDEWKRWRHIYRSADASLLERGFAAFYLNRCNRSGIIKDGGVIGGADQRGKWKMDARFNKDTLRERIETLALERERISITNLDAIAFISSLDQSEVMFFIDPPYYQKGGKMYMNALSPEYHNELAEKLRRMTDSAWVLTYDDCPEIRALYSSWSTIHPFSLQYAASSKRQGLEVMIVPRWIQLPTANSSPRVVW